MRTQKLLSSFLRLSALLLCLIFLQSGALKAQEKAAYTLGEEVEFKVEGTSTIHDWHMSSNEAKGNATITIEDGKVVSIENLTLSLEVKSLDSGKGKMNKNAYKALDEKKHPNISYTLSSSEVKNDSTLHVKGDLTISGNARPIELDVIYTLTDSGVQFKGEFPITFTQFDLKPPTAVFGTIKTGDELEIAFQTNFSQNQ